MPALGAGPQTGDGGGGGGGKKRLSDLRAGVRVKLLDYHAAIRDTAALEDDETWRLHEPELSWRIWRFWKSFDFQVPLFEGGVLAYPDWLMEDIAVLNWLSRLVEQQFKK